MALTERQQKQIVIVGQIFAMMETAKNTHNDMLYERCKRILHVKCDQFNKENDNG